MHFCSKLTCPFNLARGPNRAVHQPAGDQPESPAARGGLRSHPLHLQQGRGGGVLTEVSVIYQGGGLLSPNFNRGEEGEFLLR